MTRSLKDAACLFFFTLTQAVLGLGFDSLCEIINSKCVHQAANDLVILMIDAEKETGKH